MIKAIIIAAIVSSVALYIGNAERNRGLVKMLEQDYARHLNIIQTQDGQIDALNERIAANNARWTELVQRDRDRLDRAKAEAAKVKAERDAITAELAASRIEWQEAVAHDPELASFNRLDVPGAVFARMRHAAGQ